ncbi:hypothetical protein SDC9_166102 [bioreactor metagenome]|uniref:Polysaccharide pyruvyl transferase domain-containing protein n=1 Tax=bioreactor metagenome TaxID=1076179 RepID=A0A645FYN6_9ZZZZ
MDAEFIVTDSFHGMVFSIIFEKPFIVLANRERGLDRFLTLLQLFGLEERIILNKDNDKLTELYGKEIVFSRVAETLNNKRRASMDFLKSNLSENK